MSNPTAKQVANYYRRKRRSKGKAKATAKKQAAPVQKKTTAPAAAKQANQALSKKPAKATGKKAAKTAPPKTKATAPLNVSIIKASENLTSDKCQFLISRKKTPNEDDQTNCKLTCNDNRDLEVIKYKETFQCKLKNTEITLNLKDNIDNDYKEKTKLCHYHIKEVLGLKIKKIISVDPTVTDGEVPKRIISYEVLTFNIELQPNIIICGYSTIEGKPDIGNLIPLGDGSNDNVMVNGINVIATKDINYGDKLYLKNPGTEYKKIEPLKKGLAISGPKGPFTNENTLAPVRVLSPKKV